MRRAYENWRPGALAKELLAKADGICREYLAAGYDLTLRQLYYQFVSRDYLPNTVASYNRLGDIVTRGRLAGYLDWDYIVDRTRNLQSLMHFRSPEHRIEHAARAYRRDLWADQPTRIEVWVEKEALAGVIERVAQRWDVDYFSCRGYVSTSEMKVAAERFFNYVQQGQSVVVLHLGDHDPSGIDMTRDITSRIINTFFTQDWLDENAEQFRTEDGSIRASVRTILAHAQTTLPVESLQLGRIAINIQRIALNMNQVEEYGPPPNPAKVTDSRFESYQETYGEESWELDALPPDILDSLIDGAIGEIVDQEKYDAALEQEKQERESLVAAAKNWSRVAAILQEDET